MLDQVPRLLTLIRPRSDEDSVDRLINYYSVMLVTLCVVLVSAKQYVGSPLQCWIPAHFSGSMEEYTENYCWVQNTWYLPIKTKIPWMVKDRDEKRIEYYQWVPFILLLQAMLCLTPPRFWRFINGCSGHDPKSLMDAARTCRSTTDTTAHEAMVKTVADHLHKPRDIRHDSFAGVLQRQFRRYGIIVGYLITKSMYLTTVILQFVLMTQLLKIPNPFFGWHLWQDFIHERDWQQSGVFPRVTMCDFEVKNLGNLHRYTVQCVLLINMFNEKIFMLLWFWFAVLFFAVILSTFQWLAFLLPCYQRSYIVQNLQSTRHLGSDVSQTAEMTRFVDNFLGADVVFLLSLMKAHSGQIILSEVLVALWMKYKQNQPSPSLHFRSSRVEFDPDEKPKIRIDSMSDEVFDETQPDKNIKHQNKYSNLPLGFEKLENNGDFKEELTPDDDENGPLLDLLPPNTAPVVMGSPPPFYNGGGAVSGPPATGKDPVTVPLTGATPMPTSYKEARAQQGMSGLGMMGGAYLLNRHHSQQQQQQQRHNMQQRNGGRAASGGQWISRGLKTAAAASLLNKRAK